MRTILTILGFAIFMLLCGGLVRCNAQTVYYDTAKDVHYAYVWGNGDTSLILYVQPVYMGDTAADVRYQLFYTTDSITDTTTYLPYDFGVRHINGSDYAAWTDWQYIFAWLGNNEHLNLTYK
jgi:hypothetical protein